MPIVEIRRNSDGVTHLYDYGLPWDGNDEYTWAEGNYSCDCNRIMFFHAYDEDDFDTVCGNGAYSIRITTPEGQLLYEDDDWYSAK